jgi:hypothetical protein
MGLCVKIARDVWGTWSVQGASAVPVSHLPSLSASIDYARTACNAAPATIELFVDGMYVVVHQEHGWPRRLLAADDGACPASAEIDLGGPAKCSRFLAWLGGRRRLTAKGGLTASKEPTVTRAAGLELG